jgi:hypothetical protein
LSNNGFLSYLYQWDSEEDDFSDEAEVDLYDNFKFKKEETTNAIKFWRMHAF